MKTKLIQILYCLTAFLADKTKGFSLFSKWKITLGSLLISLSVISCKQKANIDQQKPIEPEKDTTEMFTMCYETIIEPIDTIRFKKAQVAHNPRELPQSKPVDTVSSKYDDENIMCYVMEDLASYPDGDFALMEFIDSNLQYPKEMKENKIEGTVYLEFVVTSTGDVGAVKVLRSPSDLFSEEATRVIKLTKWIPGKQSGKNVSTYFRIPIKFELEKNEN